jgi:L-threonylcarbamoyladenylate synthase
MTPIRTELLEPTPEGIARAVALLREGQLVAMPTETVYGLAGDATSDTAVARVFQAKARPKFNPLIIHVENLAVATRLATLDERALALAHEFWPGPLTLVLPLRADAGLSALATSGLATVAIRMPAHKVARALLHAFGGPLAAPSANPSGRLSPTRAEHVTEALGGRIAAVIDGGRCAVGLESTIVGLDGPARLLRPGGLEAERIEAVLGAPLLPAAHGITAPGQMISHYAPSGRVLLDVKEPHPGQVWVGFGPACKGAVLTLSATGDLTEAAAQLFHVLHQADMFGGPQGTIAFAPVPEHGLGLAINDRLRRAAAPRT